MRKDEKLDKLPINKQVALFARLVYNALTSLIEAAKVSIRLQAVPEFSEQEKALLAESHYFRLKIAELVSLPEPDEPPAKNPDVQS